VRFDRLAPCCLLAALAGADALRAAEAPRQWLLSVSDVSVSEEGCTPHQAVFTVRLFKRVFDLPPQVVTVQYSTADGTATAGVDYQATSGTLTFNPPDHLLTVSVSITDALVPGPDKTFTLDLSSPTGAVIARPIGTATLHAPSVAKCASCGLSCDDADVCTLDSCDAATGCQNVNGSAGATPYCTLAGLGNTPAPDPNFDACNAAGEWLDSDGDGFSDAAEAQGYIDVDFNGVYEPAIDVPLPGADPRRADLYLHYDYVVASDHDHNPPPEAIQWMVDAFAAHGVALHVDPQHNAIDESTAKVVTLLADPPDYVPDPACAGPSAASMHQLRQAYFTSPRNLAYRYMVLSHWSTCDSVEDCLQCPADPECGGGQPPQFGAAGIAEVAGDDAIVSLGGFVDSGTPIPLEAWAGLAMHELGHNFGLFHGGSDCDNFKPNYLSVMNYAFYTTGIPVGAAPGDSFPKSCDTDADCPAPAHCSFADGPLHNTCFRIDYSGQQLPDLNEFSPDGSTGGLDETQGLNAPVRSTDVSYYSLDGVTNHWLPTNGTPIDWNQDGTLEAHVTKDINLDGAQTLLTGSNDWATDGSGHYTHLGFDFQCTDHFDNDITAAIQTRPDR
jgi:hypothetical protein